MALQIVKIPDVQDSQVRPVYEENLELVSQCAGEPPTTFCRFCIVRLCAACCGGKAVRVRFRLGMRRRPGGGCPSHGGNPLQGNSVREGCRGIPQPFVEVIVLILNQFGRKCVRMLQSCVEVRSSLSLANLSDLHRYNPSTVERCKDNVHVRLTS